MNRRKLLLLALAIGLPLALIVPLRAVRSWQPRVTALPPSVSAVMSYGAGDLLWRQSALVRALPAADSHAEVAALPNWNGRAVPFRIVRSGVVACARDAETMASLATQARSGSGSGSQQIIRINAGGMLKSIALDGGKSGQLSTDQLALSPDGTRVAWNTAAPDGAAIADTRTGRVVARFKLPPRDISARTTASDVGALAWSPNGKLLAVADYSEVYLVDVATGKARRNWPLEQGAPRPTRAAFSPDGKLLALGFGHDKFWAGQRIQSAPLEAKFVWIHQAQSGRLLHWWTQKADTFDSAGISNLDWSPDGEHLAWGTSVASALIMNAHSGLIEREFVTPPDQIPITTGNSIDKDYFVAYAPDGATLAVASQSQVTLWRVR